MALKSINPTTTKAWQELSQHFQSIEKQHMLDMFSEDDNRSDLFKVSFDGFTLDYSKNRISEETMQLLYKLAQEVDLKDAIEKYFQGDLINGTEQRAVLHTALRSPDDNGIEIEGESVSKKVNEGLGQMKTFSEALISGTKKGHSKKAFTDVVNIGIGGSDLGPKMVVNALEYYQNHLKTHFISNIDGDHVSEILKDLDPETTLFVIVSKTFTTLETMTNANTVKDWFLKQCPVQALEDHFVAVSVNVQEVEKFGINPENTFPIWDWVGGRFSLWSAVGLSVSCAIGFDNFSNLLAGAHEMDQHFENNDFNDNAPVIMGLLGIWYNNFFEVQTEAIVPYTQYLDLFVSYLQQAIMESNGKNVDRNGDRVNYETGTVIWGAPGTNAQHAFFQLLHQGTKLIPVDFIGFSNSLHGNNTHHDILMANFYAQGNALLEGNIRDLSNDNPYNKFDGNRPSNSLVFESLTPHALGKLIALYEHKLFVQGVILNIYSFDQWGVTLGKEMANKHLREAR